MKNLRMTASSIEIEDAYGNSVELLIRDGHLEIEGYEGGSGAATTWDGGGARGDFTITLSAEDSGTYLTALADWIKGLEANT